MSISNRRPDSRPAARRNPSVLRSFPRAPRHSTHPHRQLTFGLLNVRSLHNKVDRVLEVQREESLDALFLTETWHDADSVCIRRLRQDGFTVSDAARPRSRADTLNSNHGGVAVMSVPGVKHVDLPINSTPTTFESLCVQLSCQSAVSIALLIYRTGPVTSNFFSELSLLLEFLATFSCPVFVVGDLNIHIERIHDPHSCILIDLLASFGFSCSVNAPTHDQGGTLDVVFARGESMLVHISDPGLSDHRLLTWSLPVSKPSPHYVSFTFRPYNKVSLSSLRSALSFSPLCDPHMWQSLHVHDLADLFDSIVSQLLDDLAPHRTVRLKRRPSDPWFDDECRSAKRDTRRLERLYHRLRYDLLSMPAAISDALFEWKQSSVVYRKILRRKRESYWKCRVSSQSKSPRDLWGSLNRILGKGNCPSEVPSPQELHEYFVEKVNSVRDATNTSSSPLMSKSSCRFLNFQPVSVEFVTRIVQRLANKSSPRDSLPCNLLKACIDLLAPFLAHLFNLSLQCGIFPSSWKHATITPILKKGKKNHLDVSSYRPITSLPLLSKILERIVSAQLRSHVESNDLLPSQQSAYRPKHSAETALLKITSDIFRAFDSGEICLLSFLDLSAAFDTVDHASLLKKLELCHGFSGSVLSWLTSFICDRSMSVSVKGVISSPTPVTCGVPQGSVLGPLLFILYVSDIVQLVESHNLNIHLFADDVQVFGSCAPAESSELSIRLSLCLDSVIAWFKEHRLLLNPDKSEVMWCSSKPRKKSLPHDSVRVGSSTIAPSASVRVLGVILDSHLSFEAHISRCVSSCFSALRQIRSIKRSISLPLVVTVINSLVLSRLDYCVSLFNGVSKTQLRRLQSVLNASARLVFSASRFSPVSPYLRVLRFLPIQARIEQRLSVLAHNCLVGHAPTYLSEGLCKLSESHTRPNLRSSTSFKVAQPRSRHPTLGGRAFPAAAAKIWNRLPSSVQSAPAFKKEVKRYYLETVFK